MSTPFQAFLENLQLNKLEGLRLYYGYYRAEVFRNDDPEKRGRIQARIPNVGQISVMDRWIEPSFDSAGSNRGMFNPPEKGDSVWVGFEIGDPGKPLVYFGGWYGSPDNKSEVPSELAYGSTYPDRRGWVTRMGHSFIFDETVNGETVTLQWHKAATGDSAISDRSKTADRTKGDFASLVFSNDGITIKNKNQSTISLSTKDKGISITDENNNSITMDKTGITVKSSKDITFQADKIFHKANKVFLGQGGIGSPVARATELVSWLRLHTHLVVALPNPSGVTIPTLPPTLPPPSSISSTVSTTS